jgi:hypothetical protein
VGRDVRRKKPKASKRQYALTSHMNLEETTHSQTNIQPTLGIYPFPKSRSEVLQDQPRQTPLFSLLLFPSLRIHLHIRPSQSLFDLSLCLFPDLVLERYVGKVGSIDFHLVCYRVYGSVLRGKVEFFFRENEEQSGIVGEFMGLFGNSRNY